MGVRFACHACGKHLNIKQELAGRRGVCPSCSARFRIPLQDAPQSTPIEQASHATQGQAPDVAPERNINASSQAPSGGATAVAEKPKSVSTSNLLAGDPDATWYVRPPTGGQYGPANGEVLRQWIGEGRVAATALLWRDGWPQWREASDALPELSKQFPESQKTAVSTSHPSSPTSATVQTNAASSAPAHADERATAVAPIIASSNATSSASASSTSTAPNVPLTVSTPITSDNFGYEDSDFAGTGSYTSITTDAPRLTGREDVGSLRRSRATRRTASIVMLGLVALLLVAAIVYLITRYPLCQHA